MSPALFEIGVGLVMVAVAVSLLVWFTRDQRANSERRMTRMLLRAGVDPGLAARGDQQAIVKDIRSRCRRCAAENLCERWLAGKEGGENTFCPNERIFSVLAKARGPGAAAELQLH